MQILSSMLVLYSWVVVAILILFLFLIGRFYEIKFRQRSYYQLLLVPLGLFLAAAIWDMFLSKSRTGNPLLDFVGEPGPELLLLIGGVTLIGLCYSLYRTMMGGKR
jgi:membrane protease YdiL (CAAX protease family)